MKRLFKYIYFNLHWIISLFFVIYVTIPLLAPVFLQSSNPRTGWWIHTVYHFGCHQRAERSLFFFGDKLTYTSEELQEHGYKGTIIGYPYIGDEEIGYKSALCVRCLFLYSAMGITGILICANVLRPKLSKWLVILGLAPMILDGGIQFVSEFLFYTQVKWGIELAKPFYISNNVTRAITGTLFGITFGIVLIGEMKKVLLEERTWQKKQIKQS